MSGVAERLAKYESAKLPTMSDDNDAESQLVERAATLLAVMPRNQLRKTIEGLLSPNDLERGRKAIDLLIDAAFAIEDDTGRLRPIA